MSSQSELFDRAAECERLMNRATDAGEQFAYRMLRDMWISLGNESEITKPDDLQKQIRVAEDIQAAVAKDVK